jgi:hypothetical protein
MFMIAFEAASRPTRTASEESGRTVAARKLVVKSER